MTIRLVMMLPLTVSLLAVESWAIQGAGAAGGESSSKSQSIHALASVQGRADFIPEPQRPAIKPGIARLADGVASFPATRVNVAARDRLPDRPAGGRPQAAMQRADARQGDHDGVGDRHHGRMGGNHGMDNAMAASHWHGGFGGHAGFGCGRFGNGGFAGYPFFGSPFGYGNYDPFFYSNGFYGPGFFGGDFFPVGFVPVRSVTIMYADPEARRWDAMLRGIHDFAAGKSR